ncbi:Capsule biosynthesis protein CapA [Microbacterium azadirachtae]|uniref:Capsule biosynthesis protein CapA n=1 Tax=Microbacterium azadirachtae TaxID=582680 RepID=A0A0F0KP59_9MICO|nr:CapA family protein [Microbacterium azadirachtae]KJL21915.1 Capsule biosynthesis protein CapA [Microbacterium azadirachtae]
MTGAGTTPRPRLAWADTAKGLLIVLVVFWHVVMKSYLTIDWRLGIPLPGVWGLVSDIAYPVRMPLFFLISGCFAANAVVRPWAAVWRSRVVRFLYLYLLWTLIHTATMQAFPDFPTLVPRSVAEFVEAITISPPNAWYLYALALYFLVAKALRRLPAWMPLAAAAALTTAVGAGLIDVVSNRGSLLANLLYFLIGTTFSRRIIGLAARPRPLLATASAALYLGAFAVVRATGTDRVPGVWPAVALVGVGAGIAVAPLLAAVPRLGRGLARLGSRTLQIYVIHMPVLALADSLVAQPVSDAGRPVQLAAAVLLPVVLTAAVIAASVAVGALITRDRLSWLFDLPALRLARGSRSPRRPPQPHARPRIPWRTPAAVLGLVAVGIVATGASALPAPPATIPQQSAHRAGEVSIGATGDILLYDASRSVPSDGGAGHFDRVRPWFTEDIVTGNLEQAISPDTGHDKCGKDPDCLAFRSDPGSVAGLRGFDILNLANNHSRDFGQTGYDDTRATLAAAGIRAVGGRDEIVYSRIGAVTVAMIGFAPYEDFTRVTDLRHVRAVVRAAAARADVVVVQAHMGAEGPNADAVTPGTESMYGEDRGDPIAFSHAAVDAGADLVLGHGPHVLRGMEWYRGRLIAYSLGNFGGGGVFGKDPATRYGAYLSIRLRADGTVISGQVHSVRFDYADGIPMPDPAGGAAQLVDQRGRRDFGGKAVKLDPDGTIAVP